MPQYWHIDTELYFYWRVYAHSHRQSTRGWAIVALVPESGIAYCIISGLG